MRSMNHTLLAQTMIGAAVLLTSAVAIAQGVGTSTAATSTTTAAEPAPPPPESAPPSDPPAGVEGLQVGKKYPPSTSGLDRTGTPSAPAQVDPLPEESAKPGEDRPVPSFEGRPERSPHAGEVLIWVPRIALLPVHLTLEYLVRWPMVKGLTALERYKVIDRTIDFFQFFDGRAGLYPTALLDFGVNPSVGFLAYFNDMVSPGDRISLQAGFWTNDWLRVALRNKNVVFRDDSARILTRVEWLNRPDRPFYGVGPDSVHANESFFRQQVLDAETGLEADVGEMSDVAFRVGYRYAGIRSGQAPRIEQSPIFGNGRGGIDLGAVPSFVDDYQLLYAQLDFSYDTRQADRAFTSGSGLRLNGFGSAWVDPSDTNLSYVTFGGRLGAFLDVTGRNHVLGISVYTELLERVGDGEVPFPELIRLGGDRYLRGFLDGRLRGESAFALVANYRYPIWSFLDADLFAALGNVYGPRLKDIAFDRMFLNWGLGLRTNASRDSSLDLLIAFGSNRLDEPSFRLDNVRLLFGFSHGF